TATGGTGQAFVAVATGGGYGAARTARVLDALQSQEQLAAYVRRLLDHAEMESFAHLRIEWGDTSTTLVPGGGLAAHELAGGHSLLRHVGLDEASLRARLRRQPMTPQASSFPDRRTAEALLTQALTVEAATVA